MKPCVPVNMNLRKVCVDDHEWLVELHDDPEVLRNVTHPQKITLEQHLLWWNRISNMCDQARLIFEIDHERVGFTKFYDIDHINHSCVLGADIHGSHRGKGYAKYMWTLMLDKCFYELELHRVSLTTACYNAVGQHIYSSLGFVEEGRLIESLYRDGNYHDQICMYMLRRDWANR